MGSRSSERFWDIWGARSAVVIAAAATVVLIALCAQSIAIHDPLLAHAVAVDGDGWRVAYADAVCQVDDVPECTPEQIGTMQVILAIQLASIVMIVLLGAAARWRRLPAITHVVDLVILTGCLGGGVAAVWWSWTHLEPIDALIASGVIPLLAGWGLQRRWRHRKAMGPVAIIAFFLIKGAALSSAMTPAIVGLKVSIREAFPSSVFAGPVFMVIGGLFLAVPVAFALLAFHPK